MLGFVGRMLNPLGKPAASGDLDTLQQRAKELEARNGELERTNSELERKLDEDGRQFLEALLSLENEVEELTKQNRKLVEERAQTEEQLKNQGSDGELRAKNMRMERECQDMLQQLDEFEREKEEELQKSRDEALRLHKQIAEHQQEFSRRMQEMEREKASLLEAMTEEGQELGSRIEKLTRDKEALSSELAKASARADVGGVGSAAGGFAGGDDQMRQLIGAREGLKDEVTNKEGQIALLRSQLEIVDRKLRLADMENAMLKSECEVLKRNGAQPGMPNGALASR